MLFRSFAAALAAIAPLHEATIIVGDADVAGLDKAVSLAAVESTRDRAAVARAFAAVDGDTIAKFLFPSGSTGEPKAVVNTQRMLTASQEAKAQIWPFVERAPPVILDWLPWSHTFGANHNFNLVLRNGGTLYIDGGKPAPGIFNRTLANLRATRSNIYFNVPLEQGWAYARGMEAAGAATSRFLALGERAVAVVYCSRWWGLWPVRECLRGPVWISPPDDAARRDAEVEEIFRTLNMPPR